MDKPTVNQLQVRQSQARQSRQVQSDEKKRGGAREGAGRKVGTGKFNEPTEVMRVPMSQKATVANFLQAYADKQEKQRLHSQLDVVAQFEWPALAPVQRALHFLIAKSLQACRRQRMTILNSA